MISIFNKVKYKWHFGDSKFHIVKLYNNFCIHIARDRWAEHEQTSQAHESLWAHFPSLISAALKCARCATKSQSLFTAAVGKIMVDFRGLDNVQRATALGTARKPWDIARSRIYCCLTSFLEISSIFPPAQVLDIFQIFAQHDHNSNSINSVKLHLMHPVVKGGQNQVPDIQKHICVSVDIHLYPC